MALAKRILVVDDEPIVCKTIHDILSALGYDVTVLHDGLQAKKHLETQAFNLILSDLSMPGFDGMSLLKHIQEQQIHTPVIILASLMDPSVEQRALDQGAKACLDKPVQFQQLQEHIERYIQ